MKVNYSLTWANTAGQRTISSTLRSPSDRKQLDVINDYILEGRRAIQSGLEMFSAKRDSEAAPRLELGSHFLYIIAAAKNIEQNNSISTVDESLVSDKEKIELYQASLSNDPITNLIYYKKLLVFSRLCNITLLETSITNPGLRNAFNKALDELFKEHRKFLPEYIGNFTPLLIKGIKAKLIADAYICLSRNQPPTINLIQLNLLLQNNHIPENQDFLRLLDNQDFISASKELANKANNVFNFPNADTELTGEEIRAIIDFIKQNNRSPYGNQVTELFYSKPPIPQFIAQSFGQSIIVSATPLPIQLQPPPSPIIPNRALVETTKQIELTEYQKWKEADLKDPFSLLKLTKEDIDKIFASDKKGRKDLFLKYLQLLNNGRLPHGESSPRKGKLFSSRDEKKIFPGLNKYLEELNITPLHIFNPQNVVLRNLYLIYKQKSKSQSDSIEENFNSKQLEQICLYLDANKNKESRDIDFNQLTIIDPDFGKIIFENNFLDTLLELATKPKAKEQNPVIGTQGNVEQENDPAYSLADIKPEEANSPINHPTESAPVDFSNAPTITGIKIPLLNLLGFDNYLETGKLPSGEELVVVYKKKKHVFGTHSKTHDDVHNYHKGKHTVEVIVTYSDGSTRNIKPYITNVKHALKELSESGQSTYVLKDHHESN